MGRVSDAKPRLMTAVMELIWTGSYGATTIDQICEKAQVKKGSFYYFFDSKADLAVAALDEEWSEKRPELDSVFSPTIAPLERLRKYCELMYKFQPEIQQKYGHAADYVQAAAAAGVVAQQTAVETLGLAPPLGDKEREAVMEQLHRQDIQTLYGRVKFGADGGIVQKPPIAVQNQGGKFVMVYPAEVGGAKATKLVYPLTAWRSR